MNIYKIYNIKKNKYNIKKLQKKNNYTIKYYKSKKKNTA